MWHTMNSATVSVGSGSIDQVAGLTYIHYLREDLAMTVGAQTASVVVGNSFGTAGSFSGTASVFALPVGVRWQPFRARLTVTSGLAWQQRWGPRLA
jgi:hypothetical protein